MPITIKVCFIVASLVGQLTLFISRRDSFRKAIIILGNSVIFIAIGNVSKINFKYQGF